MGFNGILTGNIVTYDQEDIQDIIIPIITKPVWDTLSDSVKMDHRIRFIVYKDQKVIRKNCTLRQFLKDIVPPVVFSKTIGATFNGNITLQIYEYIKTNVTKEDIDLAENFDLSNVDFDAIESYDSYNLPNFIICVTALEVQSSTIVETLPDDTVRLNDEDMPQSPNDDMLDS